MLELSAVARDAPSAEKRGLTPVLAECAARPQKEGRTERYPFRSNGEADDIDRLLFRYLAYLPRLDVQTELFEQELLELPCSTSKVSLVMAE